MRFNVNRSRSRGMVRELGAAVNGRSKFKQGNRFRLTGSGAD